MLEPTSCSEWLPIYEQSNLGLLTSGAPAPGMNATIRAIVRTALARGRKPYLVKKGFNGLIENDIVEATWEMVEDIINCGGSFIGAGHCEEFRKREGMTKAVMNLLNLDIFNLIAISGDGSMAGLEIFRVSWNGIIYDLKHSKKISMKTIVPPIRVIGIYGALDNDTFKIDRSVRAETGVARIVKKIDAIKPDCKENQGVTFIVEVIGKRCGHLSLTASLAVCADFVFIPEVPPDETWRKSLVEQLDKQAKMGRNIFIVILAQGSVDEVGAPITKEDVQQALREKGKSSKFIVFTDEDNCKGAPVFYDRFLGSRLGREAVHRLLKQPSDFAPFIVGQTGTTLQEIPMNDVIRKTVMIDNEIRKKNYDNIAPLRGQSFLSKIDTIRVLALKPNEIVDCKKFAVLHVGESAPGMNAATFGLVRAGAHHGAEIVGVRGSWSGFVKKDFVPLKWESVDRYMDSWKSRLGSVPDLPRDVEAIANIVDSQDLAGFILIGGFEAFHSACILLRAREKHLALKTPIIVIPAALRNNIPGTVFSLGADTILNELCASIDELKNVAAENKRKLITLIHINGDTYGYLAMISAITSGADAIVCSNEDATELPKVVERAPIKFKATGRCTLVVCGGNSPSPDTLQEIMEFASKNTIEVTVVKLSIKPCSVRSSAFDRQMGVRMGSRAIEALSSDLHLLDGDNVVLLGSMDGTLRFSPLPELIPQACFTRKSPCSNWWASLRDVVYDLEGVPVNESILSAHASSLKKVGRKISKFYEWVQWVMNDDDD